MFLIIHSEEGKYILTIRIADNSIGEIAEKSTLLWIVNKR